MPELHVGRERAADQGDRRSPQDQQRHRDRQRDDLGQDQAHGMRDAHHRQRVQLFGDAHHAELRRDGRARAPRHQHRGDHRTELADDAHAEKVDDEDIGAERFQLLGRKIGQHHADEKAHQGGDAQRLRADAEHAGGNLAPRPAQRMAHQRERVDQDLPQQLLRCRADARRRAAPQHPARAPGAADRTARRAQRPRRSRDRKKTPHAPASARAARGGACPMPARSAARRCGPGAGCCDRSQCLLRIGRPAAAAAI